MVARRKRQLKRLDPVSLNPPDDAYPFIDWDDLDPAQKAEVALLAVDPDSELNGQSEMELRTYAVASGASRDVLIQAAETMVRAHREDAERKRQAAQDIQAKQTKQQLMAMPHEINQVEQTRRFSPGSLARVTCAEPIVAYACLTSGPFGWRRAKPGEMVMAIAAEASVATTKNERTHHTVLALMK